jgi:hypothetical protein
MIRHFIGVDPGPTPGIVHLTSRAFGRRLEVDVIQCTSHVAPSVLWMLLNDCRSSLGEAPALVAIERFVVGRTSMKSGRAGEETRDLIGKLQKTAAEQPNVSVVLRSAAEIKPWATDVRLAHAGLLNPTKGMRHARDAARHALFAAVKDGGLPDPLSKEFKR